MPPPNRCNFSGCDTPTLSAYCWKHERLLRSEAEDDGEQVARPDHPLARELAAIYAVRAENSADARM